MILELNGQRIDVSLNNSFALSFSASKLQDIESRSGDFSTTFTLPLSNEVRRAIGYTNHLDSGSLLPYQIIDANVYNKGLLIFSGFAKIERVTDNLELSVYSGNSNWIELIRGKKLNEIDYSILNFTMNAANVEARRLNLDKSGIVYPNAYYGAFQEPTTPWTLYDFFPAYYCNGILLRLFLDIGWSVAGDLFTNAKFLDSLVPFSGPKIGTDVSLPLFDVTLDLPTNIVNSAPTIYLGFPSASINILDTINVPSISVLGPASPPYPYVRVHDDCFYEIIGSINWTLSIGSVSIGAVWLTPQGEGEEVLLGSGATSTGISFGDTSVFLKKGTYTLRFYVDATSATLSGLSGSFYCIVNSNQNFAYKQNVPAGQTVQLNKGLPDVLQTDFIKTIVNQFNVVIEADYINKIVKFNQFDNLESNKIVAKDWTNKVDLSEPIEIEFEQDTYGQVNHLTYEQDDADDFIVVKTLGDSTFSIANTNLEQSKEVVTLPFSCSVRAFVENVDVIVLPARLADIKPRILLSEYTNQNLITMVGQAAPSNSIELKFDGLDFDTLLAENYSYLISILQKYKLAKINFKLNSIDLQNLEYTKPIFLNFETKENGQIKGYFYLNFLDQFTDTQTTKVELIKI